MGNKKFYDLMILDTLQGPSNKKILDENDVVSIRDYMQVLKKNFFFQNRFRKTFLFSSTQV